MNRYARKIVTCASIISAVALVPVGAALAQQATGAHQEHRHPHRSGLLGGALKLDSLTPDQRTAIEALKVQRHAAAASVRAADAQVLTLLAQEIEQGSVDTQALAPALGAEHSAATTERAADEGALNQLHALLTPAQRGKLVDRMEESSQGAMSQSGDAGHGKSGMWGAKLGLTAQQKAQIATNLSAERADGAADGANHAHPGALREQALETFRGDSFDASALVRIEHRGDRAETMARAIVPVLSPAQRATFASGLRARATHESHS